MSPFPFMLDLRPHEISVHQLIPFPGTIYYTEPARFGIRIADPKAFESFCYGGLDGNIQFDYLSHGQLRQLLEDTAAALEAAGYVNSDQAGPGTEYIYTTPLSRNSMNVFRPQRSGACSMKLERAPNQLRPTLDQLRLPGFARREVAVPLWWRLKAPMGPGKSTFCHRLARASARPRCLGTDDAWFSDAFKTRMIRDAEWFVSAMFFLSGCWSKCASCRSCPQPLIIMDRSLWSTLAVQGAAQPRTAGYPARHAPAGRRPNPGSRLTLVFDASFETCQSRIARKSGEARLLDDLTANAGVS